MSEFLATVGLINVALILVSVPLLLVGSALVDARMLREEVVTYYYGGLMVLLGVQVALAVLGLFGFVVYAIFAQLVEAL